MQRSVRTLGRDSLVMLAQYCCQRVVEQTAVAIKYHVSRNSFKGKQQNGPNNTSHTNYYVTNGTGSVYDLKPIQQVRQL